MFTQPADLPEALLSGALADGWGFRPARLSYQAVGFGSHHWLAVDPGGLKLFVTVDDLSEKLRDEADTTSAVFGRLGLAFESALSLRRDAGLDFVVAPLPATGGRVLRRLTGRYSLVVHPYLAGCQAGQDGEFGSNADRHAVLALLARLHSAKAARPPADNFVIPGRAPLLAAMHSTGEPWQAGPYGTRSRDLLAAHATDLRALLAAYDQLTGRVRGKGSRMVITHGGPDAGNVLKTPAGLVFVDWESALLAPPERDLWALAESDPGLLGAYTAATGTAIDTDALALYRMWFDLAEISLYIRWFHNSHDDTADAAEGWRNLQYYLRSAQRWPDLLPPSAAGT
ncbi:MAG TPA: phosphotransferase [Streptosporangiaceae bacterium]|nr:phosphotransferase [Streptosporangiaceae bacterium]